MPVNPDIAKLAKDQIRHDEVIDSIFLVHDLIFEGSVAPSEDFGQMAASFCMGAVEKRTKAFDERSVRSLMDSMDAIPASNLIKVLRYTEFDVKAPVHRTRNMVKEIYKWHEGLV
jgi:hypothetical protein